MDCHEFARLRFTNSRNDTTPKPPQKTQAHHKIFLFVILSDSEVSIKSKCDFSALRCILNPLDFSLSIESSKWQNSPSLWNNKVCFLCLSLRASKASVAIYKFKCKFTFGLPRICTLTLCKFSQWRIPCHTYKFFRIDLIFIIITALCHTEALAEVSKNPLHCHTELSQESEVSTNLKCKFTF